MPSPIPKSPQTRQRRNKTPGAATLEQAPRIRIPVALPEPRVIQTETGTLIREWHEMAVDFWKEVRRSPMVKEYVQADLPGLLILADMVDLYWYGAKSLGSEIRLQRQCFGLTPLDRRRLQWEVKRVEDATKKQPTAEPPANPEAARALMRALA